MLTPTQYEKTKPNNKPGVCLGLQCFFAQLSAQETGIENQTSLIQSNNDFSQFDSIKAHQWKYLHYLMVQMVLSVRLTTLMLSNVKSHRCFTLDNICIHSSHSQFLEWKSATQTLQMMKSLFKMGLLTMRDSYP
jgi:hypothetical protein